MARSSRDAGKNDDVNENEFFRLDASGPEGGKSSGPFFFGGPLRRRPLKQSKQTAAAPETRLQHDHRKGWPALPSRRANVWGHP
jgi:hypothetical protein